MINGPGSSGGYRSLWHSLEMEGLRIPRVVVQDLLKELDPDEVKARKAHCLKRRVYCNPGPNYSWHIDGYDKLKPWGFPIHGAIDGFSRRILWLHVTCSNNSSDNIATFYLNTVKELGGCPVELVTDLGTENAIVAGAQSYFRDNSDSRRYVASPRNQRIEGWWSFFCKNRSNWWRTFFQDLENQHIFYSSCELSKECLWYCFSGVIQDYLNAVMEHWNTHYIRQSRHDTVPGRPDSLFFLPEQHGAMPSLFHKVIEADIQCITVTVVQNDVANDYHEYFDYVIRELDIESPKDWREACQLYCKLMFFLRMEVRSIYQSTMYVQYIREFKRENFWVITSGSIVWVVVSHRVRCLDS